MRKLLFSLCFVMSIDIAFAQRLLQCDICLTNPTSTCVTPFALSCGTTYTFTTSTTTNASYYWTVTGNLTIVGPRKKNTVQVQATASGNGKICLVKSVDGQDPCCICKDVVMDCPQQCPSLFDFSITNSINTDPNWCCDAAGNFLDFSWAGAPGTATITFRKMSDMAIVQQYFGATGGTVGFPVGVPLSNQNPPPCDTYLVLIQNDCNPQDVLGIIFDVVHCNFGKAPVIKPVDGIKMEAYPNPVTNNNLTVKLSGITAEQKKDLSKIIFTMIDPSGGQRAGTWVFSGAQEQFNITTNGITKGVYFLVANVAGKNVTTKVIIR